MAEVLEKPTAFGKLGKSFSSWLAEPPKAPEDRAVAQSTAAPAQQGLRQIPIARLVTSPYQPRTEFIEQDLQELSDSISRNGILQPILVRQKMDGSFEIVAGERRFRAAQMAHLTEVPVVVKQLTDREVMEIALIENVQRRDLSPVEEAFAYRRLLGEFGYTQEELARAVGKSRSHIANLMRLLSLPAGVKDLLAKGKITMGHARALLGVDNAEELAERIANENLNVRQTEELAQVAKEEQDDTVVSLQARKKGRVKQKAADILSLEDILARSLGSKVDIKSRGKKGEIRIKYKSLEELDNLMRKLNVA